MRIFTNRGIQRMRASLLAQLQYERLWRLARTAVAMRRAIAILVACAACAALALAWREADSRRSHFSTSLGQTLKKAVTNPVEFAKNRFTGGIGVTLSTHPTCGLPVIAVVSVGSPAHKANLREGDLIMKVNGLATTNVPVLQIVDEIRGFAGGRVTLTIQRGGTTNIECVIKRSSWHTMDGR